jgi:hypothetical protein
MSETAQQEISLVSAEVSEDSRRILSASLHANESNRVDMSRSGSLWSDLSTQSSQLPDQSKEKGSWH